MAAEKLFTAFKVGAFALPSRIVMAPLTRGRAEEDGTPNELMRTYYKQRSSAALIVTEATAISKQGYGWFHAPGIFTDKHEEGWKPITDAIHSDGGRIFLQLWHMGRVSHPDFQDGDLPVAPSPVAAQGSTTTKNGKQEYVEPRELTTDEIAQIVQDYAAATIRAKNAGFDGVEIHAANGYLIDQFIRDGSNKRTDEYGGSIQNRVRFLKEVTEAVVAAWDKDHVGVRISPVNPYNSMIDSNPAQTFAAVATVLQNIGVAYLHVVEAPKGHMMWANVPPVSPSLRKIFKRAFIANGGYDADRANEAVSSGAADLVAFGVPFLANPDLPKRLKQGLPLNKPDFKTFYTQGEEGYTDYPNA